MIRSMLALLLILVGVPLIVAALNGDPTVIETQDARLHGLYAGVVLVIVGFVLGKFWSLKWQPKRSPQWLERRRRGKSRSRSRSTSSSLGTRRKLPLFPYDFRWGTPVSCKEMRAPAAPNRIETGSTSIGSMMLFHR